MFCQKITAKIKQLLRQFNTYVQDNVDTALKVTTALKAALESVPAQVLTAIIPTDIDETIRVRLVDILGKSIDVLSVVSACKDETTVEGKVQCFIKQLAQYAPAVQDALLHKLAAIIAAQLDGNTKAQNVYDLFVQAQYSATK